VVDYSRASRDDLADVAEFVASLNVLSQHRIGYFGDKPEEVTRELLEYGAIDNAFMARQGETMVGFLAMDIDEELNRSYLYGPLVKLDPWDEIALELVARCLELVPDAATDQLEMFFDLDNSNVTGLGQELGFETYKDVRTLKFARADLEGMERGSAAPLDERHHDGLIALHDRLFPNTYLPGRRMVDGLGEHKACFVRTEDDEVLGYAYVEVDNSTGAASLEFVGTDEGSRGRGIGADLVRTSLHWMFGFASVAETWLVVDEENRGAQKLYERLRWTEVHRLTSMRRKGRPSLMPRARSS
jgi:ribosomal protein S18 acetylase RimI-like enzyme